MQRPQKTAFGEMRESGVRGVLVFAQITDAATTSPPAQIPGRMMSGYPIWSGVSSAPLAAGAADIRPDVHWDKPGALMRGD